MNRRAKAAEFEQQGYDFHVTGRHVNITESMKNYAVEKISKVEKFTNRIIDVQVAMDIQKLEHKVDIIFRFNNIKIKSSASTTDMYVSIDMAVEKLEKQIHKYKDRLQDHQSKAAKEVDMNVNVILPHRDDDLNEINSEIDQENQKEILKKYTPHTVVLQEKKPLKYLSVSEAVMKLELSQDVFLIYRSEEDHKIKILYRRNDGNYGVIEPE